MPRHSPFRRHTLLLKFFNGIGGFFDSADAHPFEHVRCFSELDVIVGNHLDSVAPRVAKIEPPIQCLNSQLYQRSAYRLPVVYDKTEMALVVRLLGPAEEADDKRHRSEEHTSELQSRSDLVCRPLLEKKQALLLGHLLR